MPKKIDPAVKARCVRQVQEHLPEYPSLTAAAEAVARREGLGKETVRRWAAVESICRVLREQGCQVAARSYREWARANRTPASRVVSDAGVINAGRDIVWQVDHQGVRRMTPEGLYGRRKMITSVRRHGVDASPGAVDRAMRSLSLQGVRRSKGIRTTIPGKDGNRAGDLLDRYFTAVAPNRTWVMDFTYVRTWAGFVYVAFILDVFAQRREGHPIVPGELIGHADAGPQYTAIAFTEHLADEGIRPSIGTVADAYDNALMECIIGLYKTECIRTTIFHQGPYRTIGGVEYATAGWVDWYNNRRLHSTLGMMTPVEFEQAHYATLNREPQPV